MWIFGSILCKTSGGSLFTLLVDAIFLNFGSYVIRENVLSPNESSSDNMLGSWCFKGDKNVARNHMSAGAIDYTPRKARQRDPVARDRSVTPLPKPDGMWAMDSLPHRLYKEWENTCSACQEYGCPIEIFDKAQKGLACSCYGAQKIQSWLSGLKAAISPSAGMGWPLQLTKTDTKRQAWFETLHLTLLGASTF